MKKFIQIIFSIVFVAVSGMAIGALTVFIKDREMVMSLVRLNSDSNESGFIFQDTSRLVKFSDGSEEVSVEKIELEPEEKILTEDEIFGKPEKVSVANDPLSLFPQSLLPTRDWSKDDESSEESFSEEERLCVEELEMWSSPLSEPQTIRVNITTFGGAGDTGVTKYETGSVAGNRLRSLDVEEDEFVAWPMPDAPKVLGIPSVEELLGGGSIYSSSAIGKANQSMNNYLAEISCKGEDGKVKTVLARIEDRGPRKRTRFDASLAVWKALGLEGYLMNPNCPDHMVDLTIRLVPKDSLPTSEEEKVEVASVDPSEVQGD